VRNNFKRLEIDALCHDTGIKQTDEEEKSHQVQKMFTIFNKASQVLVWLGEAGRYTAIALDFMKVPGILLPSCEALVVTAEGSLPMDSDISQTWEGILDLYSRAWSRRLWVQQEIFAARRIVVKCGRFEFDFTTYKRCAGRILKLSKEKSSVVRADIEPDTVRTMEALTRMRTTDAAMLAELERQRHTPAVERGFLHNSRGDYHGCMDGNIPSMGIDCVLQDLVGLRSTHVVDCVYAALGMTHCKIAAAGQRTRRSPQPVMKIDYSRSPAQVFEDVTRYIMSEERNLRIIASFNRGETDTNELSLASWCLDYRYFRSHQGHADHPQRVDYFEIDPQIHNRPGRIILSGVKVGTSTSVRTSVSALDLPGARGDGDTIRCVDRNLQPIEAKLKLKLHAYGLSPNSSELDGWRMIVDGLDIRNNDIVVLGATHANQAIKFPPQNISFVVLRARAGQDWRYIGQVRFVNMEAISFTRHNGRMRMPEAPIESFVIQ